MKHLGLKPFVDKNFHPSWRDALGDFLYSQYFYELGIALNIERKKFIVYPEESNIFKAFQITPLNKLKGVILGMDPYHDGSADGLCFSNSITKIKSPSLSNIQKELNNDLKSDQILWDLSHWAEQGLFLFNTALTVRAHQAGSHTHLWRIFTSMVLQLIDANKDDVIWMLWGKQAQSYQYLIRNPSHGIVSSSHPSPLGAYGGANPFIGSRCFSKFNQELTAREKKEISW